MATVSTWFDDRTCERIDELAAELSAVTGLDVTRSDIVKRAVKEFLKEH